MPRRDLPEVNAGSMADIAFIMLIFFLVSTTLASDRGIKTLLPKWCPECLDDDTKVEVNERNVLALDVLETGDLSLEGNIFPQKDLKKEVMTFMLNNRRNPLYSDSYEDAIVNIRTHPDAPYEGYLETYSNVRAAFQQMRDDLAMQKFGVHYDDIPGGNDNPEGETKRREIKDERPLKLAEAILNTDEN